MLYKHNEDTFLNTTGGLNLQRSSRQRAWLGHDSVSKTIRPESLFPGSAPAARVTETLGESEAWGESLQQYCTLCVAASSRGAGVTAERRAEEGNCCLMGSFKTFVQESFLGTTAQHRVKYGLDRN